MRCGLRVIERPGPSASPPASVPRVVPFVRRTNSSSSCGRRGGKQYRQMEWHTAVPARERNGQLKVLALTVFDAGTGPVLYTGGAFTTAGGRPILFHCRLAVPLELRTPALPHWQRGQHRGEE